jgi:hypothetical protein
MKYIKNISELKSSVYKSAADKLRNMGHTKRVTNLEDWGKKKEEIEKSKDKLDMIKSVESIGTYDILFTHENHRGLFYINLDLDSSQFIDKYADWISGENTHLHLDLSIGVIPVDDDFDDTGIAESRGIAKGGVYWIGEINLHLGEFPIGEKGGYPGDNDAAYNIYQKDNLSPKLPHPVNPKGNMYLEHWEHNFLFADRRNAARFRKSIIDIFKGTIDYKETPSNPGGLKEEVMDFLCSERPIFTISEFETFIKSLGRANINRFFKD